MCIFQFNFPNKRVKFQGDTFEVPDFHDLDLYLYLYIYIMHESVKNLNQWNFTDFKWFFSRHLIKWKSTDNQ